MKMKWIALLGVFHLAQSAVAEDTASVQEAGAAICQDVLQDVVEQYGRVELGRVARQRWREARAGALNVQNAEQEYARLIGQSYAALASILDVYPMIECSQQQLMATFDKTNEQTRDEFSGTPRDP